MSYTFYSIKTRKRQDEGMWAGENFEGLVRSSQNRTLFQIFKRHLKKTNLKILEAGCGMGTWVFNLEKMGHSVIGIDYMESTIRKLKDYDPDFPVQQGDVENLDFPDNTFDVYVSLGVLEHFKEGPHQALKEGRRVLKPDGLVFITVPYLSLLRKLVAHPMRDLYFLLRKIQNKKYYFWEYRYSKEELENFLKSTGFKIIDIDIDDYQNNDNRHHIGLCADFFFLRSKQGEIWELNLLGKLLLCMLKIASPWYFCSGLHMVAINKK